MKIIQNKTNKRNTNKCLEIIYEYKGLTLRTILLKNKIKLRKK